MTEVKRTVDLAAAPAQVWAAISDFGGLDKWHPAVKACASETRGGVEHRVLTIPGDAKIIEAKEAYDPKAMTYAYRIIESPLPVDDYHSTIAVAANGKGSRVTWSSKFKPKGAPEAKAAEVIGGIYDAGFDALKKRFG